MSAVDSEIDKKFAGGDRDVFKKEVHELFFNSFKLQYLRIILIDAISYSFYKRKYRFFTIYLNYHSPSDASARWLNANFSIGSFDQIIPLIESYDKAISNSSFWVGRHGIDTYLNTFLGYYLIKGDSNAITQYLNTILDTEKMSYVLYSLKQILQKNILSQLPDELIENKKGIERRLRELVDYATKRQEKLNIFETQTLPIDEELKNDFFTNFFEVFHGQTVARKIYDYYNKVTDDSNPGRKLGLNQIFPRKAFIRQPNSFFISPYRDLAFYLASDETAFIFSELESKARLITMKQNEIENFILANLDEFDLLISKGSYTVKHFFPNTPFEESWAIGKPLNQIPGFLGVLGKKMNVFLSNQSTNSKGFLMLKSSQLGTLVNCPPPTLNDTQALTHEQFSYSFIDIGSNDEIKSELLAAGHLEELLKTEVLIRIFECIRIEDSAEFDGVSIEIIP